MDHRRLAVSQSPFGCGGDSHKENKMATKKNEITSQSPFGCGGDSHIYRVLRDNAGGIPSQSPFGCGGDSHRNRPRRNRPRPIRLNRLSAVGEIPTVRLRHGAVHAGRVSIAFRLWGRFPLFGAVLSALLSGVASQSPFGCGGDSHAPPGRAYGKVCDLVSIAFRLWGRFPRACSPSLRGGGNGLNRLSAVGEIPTQTAPPPPDTSPWSQSPFGCGGDSHPSGGGGAAPLGGESQSPFGCGGDSHPSWVTKFSSRPWCLNRLSAVGEIPTSRIMEKTMPAPPGLNRLSAVGEIPTRPVVPRPHEPRRSQSPFGCGGDSHSPPFIILIYNNLQLHFGMRRQNAAKISPPTNRQRALFIPIRINSNKLCVSACDITHHRFTSDTWKPLPGKRKPEGAAFSQKAVQVGFIPYTATAYLT